MNLLEMVAEVVVGHVEYSQVVAIQLLLKLFPLVITYYLTPEATVFFACHIIPPTLPPWVSQFHQFVMHTLRVFE
jgi:hypothetical protein